VGTIPDTFDVVCVHCFINNTIQTTSQFLQVHSTLIDSDNMTAIPDNGRRIHKLKNEPYHKLGHEDAVNYCVMNLVNHGFKVSLGALDATHTFNPIDGSESSIEYIAQKPIEDTIKLTGKKNPGYPNPWDTLQVTQQDPDPCKCGKVIGGYPICSISNAWCKGDNCDCRERIGRDLVHQCAIYGCKQRTCNVINCTLEHYETVHAIFSAVVSSPSPIELDAVGTSPPL